jgi:hypothetical protein
MLSGRLKYFFRKTAKFFYKILAVLTRLKPHVRDDDLSHLIVKFNDASHLDTKPILREMHESYAIVRKKEIKPIVKLNASPTDFKVVLPTIKISPSITSLLRWNLHGIDLLPFINKFELAVKSIMKELQKSDFCLLFKMKVRKIEDKEIKIKRKLKLTEEIVKFIPYVKKRHPSFVLKFPVIRQPLYKSNFQTAEMEKFRENLSRQAKTVRANIEIICIYDKIKLDSYASVRQNPENKELLLYLSEKEMKVTKEEYTYLVIGSRKDNKEMVKALVKLD